MIILDGVKTRDAILNELKNSIALLAKKQIVPTIAIIQIGDDEASNIYIKNKIKLCEKLNFKYQLIKKPKTINTNGLSTIIKKLNSDKMINGILVQLPIPDHIDINQIIYQIDPNKDVDCFHPYNIANLWWDKNIHPDLIPCTPHGIILLLKKNNISLEGKNVVIVGRSNIVGKPLAAMMLQENATVTICHSKTKNLSAITKNADILVSATGQAKLINEKYINSHQVIVDVGMNHDKNGKLCGDVDFEKVKNKIKAISPVPGGVGPMTTCMLMYNLVLLTKKQNRIK